jgi:hypothetical protein
MGGNVASRQTCATTELFNERGLSHAAAWVLILPLDQDEKDAA